MARLLPVFGPKVCGAPADNHCEQHLIRLRCSCVRQPLTWPTLRRAASDYVNPAVPAAWQPTGPSSFSNEIDPMKIATKFHALTAGLVATLMVVCALAWWQA